MAKRTSRPSGRTAAGNKKSKQSAANPKQKPAQRAKTSTKKKPTKRATASAKKKPVKKTAGGVKKKSTKPATASAKKKPTKRAAASSRTAKSSRATGSAAAKRSSSSATKKPPRAKSPVRKAAQNPRRKTTVKQPGRSAAVRETVDGYMATLNDWRKECVGSLRKMIRKAAPDASEKVKWSQPVYEHHGPFAWIKAHARHVNLGFWRGKELPDPRKLLEGTGQKMRHIKLSNLKDATKRELQELVRLAAKLNEIKGSPAGRDAVKSKAKSKKK